MDGTAPLTIVIWKRDAHKESRRDCHAKRSSTEELFPMESNNAMRLAQGGKDVLTYTVQWRGQGRQEGVYF